MYSSPKNPLWELVLLVAGALLFGYAVSYVYNLLQPAGKNIATNVQEPPRAAARPEPYNSPPPPQELPLILPANGQPPLPELNETYPPLPQLDEQYLPLPKNSSPQQLEKTPTQTTQTTQQPLTVQQMWELDYPDLQELLPDNQLNMLKKTMPLNRVMLQVALEKTAVQIRAQRLERARQNNRPATELHALEQDLQNAQELHERIRARHRANSAAVNTIREDPTVTTGAESVPTH